MSHLRAFADLRGRKESICALIQLVRASTTQWPGSRRLNGGRLATPYVV
jgi:hypothetical protein